MQGNGDRALSFQVPHNARHGILRRNAQAHVHMIDKEMPFLNRDVLIPSQLMENRAKILSKRAVDHFHTPFWNENNVILSIPRCMRQTLVLSHGRISSVVDETAENSTDRSNGQTHESPPE